jgi:hypothetical protein
MLFWNDSARCRTPPGGICSREKDCFALLRRTRNDGGPVSPEVIHIKPLSWLPLTARSSVGAFPPPEWFRLVQTVTLYLKALKP